MIRYNIPIIHRPQPLSSRTARRPLFGLASVLVHGVAIALLVLFVIPPQAVAPPPEAAMEMVFEPPAETPEETPEPAPVTEPPTARLPEAEPIASPPPASETTGPSSAPSSAPGAAAAPKPKPPARLVQKPRAVDPPPRSGAASVTPISPTPPGPTPPGPTPPGPIPPGPIPPGPTSISPPVVTPVDASWQASVVGWLASRKTYPEDARRRGEEGRVTVRFTVDRSGRVLDAAVISPSGSADLDAATLTLLRQASLPAFPATMTQGRITITTSIRYSLR